MLNKKADGGLTIVVVLLVIICFIGWLVNVNGRECQSNKECDEDSYCGSDFSCHKHPVIEKTTTVAGKSYVAPAIILGITLIIVAIILRWDKLGLSKKSEPKKQKEEKKDVKDANYYNYPLYYTEQVKSK